MHKLLICRSFFIDSKVLYPQIYLCWAFAGQDSTQFKERSIRPEEFNLLNSCISSILSDIRVEYVAQPSTTVRDYKYTKREFCVNSIRSFVGGLSIKFPEDNYIHLNGPYGACVLHGNAAQLSVRRWQSHRTLLVTVLLNELHSCLRKPATLSNPTPYRRFTQSMQPS